MPELNAAVARAIAARLSPVLRFSDLEPYYPIRAESWLTHASCAPWNDDPNDVAALPVDRRRRGTALCTSDPDVRDVRKIAGAPNPSDMPLGLHADDEAGIGHADYRRPGPPEAELFLSFAGWLDSSRPERGGGSTDEEMGYLRDAFGELASAMDHRLRWQPLALQPNRPWFANPQPASPAYYCEIAWAGIHAATARSERRPDFAFGALGDLDQYLQVTYHFLFPAREPLAEGSLVTRMEGQWAAASLFIQAEIDTNNLDASGRPRVIHLPELEEIRPDWIVLSRDYDEHAPSSQVRALRDGVEYAEGHVTVYVTHGSHRLLFAPADEVSLASPAESWPNVDYEPGGDNYGLVFPLIGAVLVALLWAILAIIVALVLILAWWAVILLALLAAIVALLVMFIVWLAQMFVSELFDEDASRLDVPDSREPTVSPGATAGDPYRAETEAPAANDPTQAGAIEGGDVWATNEGHVEGRDYAGVDVRVVAEFEDLVAEDHALGPPSWWHYAGRWGVKVPVSSTTWRSGSRRTDDAGRSWTHRHAEELQRHLLMREPNPGG